MNHALKKTEREKLNLEKLVNGLLIYDLGRGKTFCNPSNVGKISESYNTINYVSHSILY